MLILYVVVTLSLSQGKGKCDEWSFFGLLITKDGRKYVEKSTVLNLGLFLY